MDEHRWMEDGGGRMVKMNQQTKKKLTFRPELSPIRPVHFGFTDNY